MAPELPKAGVYIMHGDDEYGIEHTIAGWRRAMGDPTTADLNMTRLDGRSMSDNDLNQAINAMPFLAPQRLVIVRSPLSKLVGESARNRFIGHLNRLPPTTTLALVIDDHPGRKGDWETLHSTHWLRKWTQGAGEKAVIQDYALPKAAEMPEWIRREADRQGGKFSTPAAVELFKHIGSDTRLAALEINKLLNYVNFRRAVEPDDVSMLVAQVGQVDVFEVVDALGERNSRRAVQLMEGLLDKQEPLYVLSMVVRQFRLLLLVREVQGEGGGPDQVVEKLRQDPFRIAHRFMADKLYKQAGRFSIAQLELIYHRLLDLDEAFKSGGMEPRAAFATFIAELPG